MEYEKEMRVFIDSVIANDMCSAMEEDELKDKIEQYIDEGYQFVVTETALDIPLFQNDWMWFENRLTISAGKAITIELWNSVEDMLSKPFYWMSAKCETETKPKEVALESFITENVTEKCGGILDLLYCFDTFAIPRHAWKQGKRFSISNMRRNILETLCLTSEIHTPFLTRSEAYLRSQTYGEMVVFDDLNDWYVRGIAEQHNCGNLLNAVCRIVKL